MNLGVTHIYSILKITSDIKKNFDLLRTELGEKGYAHEPYETLQGNPHEMWEQGFVEFKYLSTVIIRYNNSENKSNETVTSFETWIYSRW